jgi:predicted tellurium resistance membrane protein TerC
MPIDSWYRSAGIMPASLSTRMPAELRQRAMLIGLSVALTLTAFYLTRYRG